MPIVVKGIWRMDLRIGTYFALALSLLRRIVKNLGRGRSCCHGHGMLKVVQRRGELFSKDYVYNTIYNTVVLYRAV